MLDLATLSRSNCAKLMTFKITPGVILKVINLALFLGDEAKFHAEKLHADARCHAPYLPIAKL